MNVSCKRMHLLDQDPDNDPVNDPDNFAPCKQAIVSK